MEYSSTAWLPSHLGRGLSQQCLHQHGKYSNHKVLRPTTYQTASHSNHTRPLKSLALCSKTPKPSFFPPIYITYISTSKGGAMWTCHFPIQILQAASRSARFNAVSACLSCLSVKSTSEGLRAWTHSIRALSWRKHDRFARCAYSTHVVLLWLGLMQRLSRRRAICLSRHLGARRSERDLPPP